MASKKQGDLRLLKDGVAFGPTDRAGLERLLASGRITLADHVSVRNADWMSIAEFLAAPARTTNDQHPPAADPATPVSRHKRGELRVIRGGRIVSSLHRHEVEQLRLAGRVADDDLICASNGPWMRIGDFFAPAPAAVGPPASQPPAATTERAATPRFPSTPVADVPIEAELVEPSPPPLAPTAVVPTSSLVRNPPTVRPPGASQPARSPQATNGYPLARLRPPAPPANDEWYVRVRGMYSASLRKHHVKALYQAQEVTLDSLARHGSWHANDWRPLHSIPQLADVARP
ncbi:MAG TPA: hypothetical protein VNH11_28885 [Pirellulales bacterium]|nr:hypothetical protein [Pirellulales bacterium]